MRTPFQNYFRFFSRRWLSGARLKGLLLVAISAVPVRAQLLELVPDQNPQQLFGSASRQIALRWRNTNAQPITASLRVRLFQASSATAVLLGDWFWKQLEILPRQTVLDSAQVPFPAVRGETRCLVQWVQGTNTIVGITEVLVYPTNLLLEFRPLARGESLGVFDPRQQLQALLKALEVDFVDLEQTGVANFTGKLAIIDDSGLRRQMPPHTSAQLKAAAGKGMGIVWFSPRADRHESLKPSFYVVTHGKGAVVVAQPELVVNLAENPQSQLNLLRLARLAVKPETFCLPELTEFTNLN